MPKATKIAVANSAGIRSFNFRSSKSVTGQTQTHKETVLISSKVPSIKDYYRKLPDLAKPAELVQQALHEEVEKKDQQAHNRIDEDLLKKKEECSNDDLSENSMGLLEEVDCLMAHFHAIDRAMWVFYSSDRPQTLRFSKMKGTVEIASQRYAIQMFLKLLYSDI